MHLLSLKIEIGHADLQQKLLWQSASGQNSSRSSFLRTKGRNARSRSGVADSAALLREVAYRRLLEWPTEVAIRGACK